MNRFFSFKSWWTTFLIDCSWTQSIECDSECDVDVVVTYGVCARWPVSWRWWRLTWSVLKNVPNRENRKLCRSLMTLVWLLVCSCLGCSRVIVLFVLSRGHELLFYAVSLSIVVVLLLLFCCVWKHTTKRNRGTVFSQLVGLSRCSDKWFLLWNKMYFSPFSFNEIKTH